MRFWPLAEWLVENQKNPSQKGFDAQSLVFSPGIAKVIH